MARSTAELRTHRLKRSRVVMALARKSVEARAVSCQSWQRAPWSFRLRGSKQRFPPGETVAIELLDDGVTFLLWVTAHSRERIREVRDRCLAKKVAKQEPADDLIPTTDGVVSRRSSFVTAFDHERVLPVPHRTLWVCLDRRRFALGAACRKSPRSGVSGVYGREAASLDQMTGGRQTSLVGVRVTTRAFRFIETCQRPSQHKTGTGNGRPPHR